MKTAWRNLPPLLLSAALASACAGTDDDPHARPIASFDYVAGNGHVVKAELFQPIIEPDLDDAAVDDVRVDLTLDGALFDVVGHIDRQTGYGTIIASGDGQTVRYGLEPMPGYEGGLRVTAALILPSIEREMGARVTPEMLEAAGAVDGLIATKLGPLPRPMHEGATAPVLEAMRVLVADAYAPTLSVMVMNQRAAALSIVEHTDPTENFDLLPRVPTAAPRTLGEVIDVVSPTEAPTVVPTSEPTADPTSEPTAWPTAEPTIEPTAWPTAEPTVEPTAEPTVEPTAGEPTPTPTPTPTPQPPTPTPQPTQPTPMPTQPTPMPTQPTPSPSPTPDPCAGMKSTKGPSSFKFFGLTANLWGVTIAIDADEAKVKSACLAGSEPHANGGGTLGKTEHVAMDKSCDMLKYGKSFEIGGKLVGIIENDVGCTGDGSEDQITFVHGHISGYGADITVKFGEKKLDLGCGKVACMRGEKRKVFCVKEQALNANAPNPQGKLGSGDDTWSATSSDDAAQCRMWQAQTAGPMGAP